MDQERQSRNDSNVGTGVLEPPPAAAGAKVAGQVHQPRRSTTEARVRNLAEVATTVSIPDLRLARVRAIKAQIAAGTYDVSSEQLAAALFDYLRTRTD
jgi:flagellar biosynthesis anti-sigma factor FlgM